MSAICGGREPLTKERPKDWIDTGYTILKPYDMKWRHKLGKVECDCKQMIENYQPYYGFTWYHLEDCAMLKHYDKYPGMANFFDRPNVITQSE